LEKENMRDRLHTANQRAKILDMKQSQIDELKDFKEAERDELRRPRRSWRTRSQPWRRS